MSIIRVKKDKHHPYLIMNKTGLNDKRLSLKAKGLLCYLLSKPDNWYIDTKELAANSSNGIKSILSTIKELVHYTYIQKLQFRNNNGQYSYYHYLVFENPQQLNSIKTTTSPKRPFRFPDKRLSDNSTLLSNNKDISNNTATAPSLKHPPSHSQFAADADQLNKKLQTIQLLNSLKIKNHKKLFDLFPISDIFQYATWIQDRNVQMRNPTGFLIAAIKENWIDYEPIDQTSNLNFYWVRCPACKNSYGYHEETVRHSTCPKCKITNPKSITEHVKDHD